MRVDDRVGERPAALAARDERRQQLVQDQAKVRRVLPGDQVAVGGGSHGGQQAGRRLCRHVHRLDLAQAAGLGEANRLIDQPAVVGRQRLQHCADAAVVSGWPRGTAASGARNRTIPRLVLVATAARVAAIASSTARPTPVPRPLPSPAQSARR